jgi:hypothetical protein
MKTQNTTLYIILGSIVATIYATIFMFGVDSPVKCALIFTAVIVLLFLAKIVYPLVPVVSGLWQKINVNIQKKIIFVLILVFFTAVCLKSHWLIYYEPAFKGTILDIDTKQPIEGAVIVIVYKKEVMGLGAGSFSKVINIREVLTDKEGKFETTFYATLIQPFSWQDQTIFLIYKPGYANIELTLKDYFTGQDTREQEGSWPDQELRKYKFKLRGSGIVELPKLKTREERSRSIPSLPDELNYLEKQSTLTRLINEENKNLGFGETDPYKAREFILNMGKGTKYYRNQ